MTRFLAVKSEVVTQVKKRLLTKGEWGLGSGTEDDLDIFVYMGDVQGKHDLCLLQSVKVDRMVQIIFWLSSSRLLIMSGR